MSRDLSRLLRPASIAVFGSVWAENVIRQCDKMGFAGEVWPVHPTREAVGGRPAFRSVADLPGPPDAAFVGVNRDATLDVVAELRAAGAGGAVLFAAGFSEAGDAARQSALLDRAGDMPFLGPNCYGLINALDGAIVWPDVQGCRPVGRGVAILSQSSNIAITLTMQRRALPVAYVGCLGNAAQTGIAELASAMLADNRVSALGVYMEGVGDAAAFAETVETARAAGKGVVVLKAGRTEGGRAAALTHTASLAGEAAVSSAYLARIGAAEVGSLAELVETLKILHVRGPLASTRLISVSCSGGEAGLMADAADTLGIDLPPLSAATRAELAETLGPRVTLANPLDYHTYIWGDRQRMGRVFHAALAGYDAAVYVLDPPRRDTCDTESFEPAIEAVAAATLATGRPAFVVSTLPDTIDETLAERLIALGVVPLLGLSTALSSIRAAALPPPRHGWRPMPVVAAGAGRLLDEAAAKARLALAGIAVPRGVTGPEPGALDISALTPPFALKGLGLAHKSEAGAVRLGVTDPAAETPMDGVEGYLLEEMVAGSVAEVLLGCRRDPVYGTTLTLGAGGVLTELLADTATLVCPVTADEVAGALARLRSWPLLNGFRGRATGDVGAVVRAALALQDMLASDPAIAEVEINPLIVRETGAVAVDALVKEMQ